jgi:competence protein ComEC
MEIHFIDVGIGNMTLLCFPNNTTYLYDCNVTEDNEDSVLAYLTGAMGARRHIDVFICSHRDADHMRGIGKVHERHPILQIRDPGVPGTTTDTPEYEEYMELRRQLPRSIVDARTFKDVGDVKVRYMNSHDDTLSDPNDQSIVMKLEYAGSSVLLAGDTSLRPWKDRILPYYSDAQIQADILLAPHHGSLTFFDDPSDRYYYVAHMERIRPDISIISVGPNVHGLPDSKAVKLYEKHSAGSNKGDKVFTTEQQGNMKVTLAGGSWTLEPHQ